MRPPLKELTAPQCTCRAHHFKAECYYAQPKERREWNEYVKSLPDVYNNLPNPEDLII